MVLGVNIYKAMCVRLYRRSYGDGIEIGAGTIVYISDQKNNPPTHRFINLCLALRRNRIKYIGL